MKNYLFLCVSLEILFWTVIKFSVVIVHETVLVAFWLLSCHSSLDDTLASGCSLACPGLPATEEKVGKMQIKISLRIFFFWIFFDRLNNTNSPLFLQKNHLNHLTAACTHESKIISCLVVFFKPSSQSECALGPSERIEEWSGNC